MAIICNSPIGYSDKLDEALSPLTKTFTNLIVAHKSFQTILEIQLSAAVPQLNFLD